MTVQSSDIFRPEAVAHHGSGQGREGRVLRIHPTWTTWAWWLLVLVVLAGAVFALFARINQYASGPAIIRIADRTVLTAPRAGAIAGVRVQPGQRVAADEVLLQLDDTLERAELERIDREIELQTRKVLAQLDDADARRALVSLQADRQRAIAELSARQVRAPHAGLISDIRVRSGQHLAPGEIILALLDERAGFEVIGLLPGQYRPMLAPGAPLRLELSGYRYAYQSLTIDAVGAEVVGPVEARRYLGADVADAVALSGPVVVVRSRLPAREFSADRRVYQFYDGMPGTAEARIRSENVVLTLVPGLKPALGLNP